MNKKVWYALLLLLFYMTKVLTRADVSKNFVVHGGGKSSELIKVAFRREFHEVMANLLTLPHGI